MTDLEVRPLSSPPRAFQYVRILFAAGAFLGFGVGAPFLALWMVLLWCLGGEKLERRKRCQRALGGTFRFFHAYMRVVGLIDYRPELTLPPREGPRILIANHPSLVDVTAILATHPEACCLVKGSIFNNPLFFPIMKFCGHILVRRGDPSGGSEALSDATARLADGSDVLLFPEGTRSETMGVGPFRAGAFALAVHAEATLAPILIFCDRPVLKRGTPWYLIPPQTVTLQLKNLEYLTPLEDEPINRLKERAHTLFQTSLQSPTSFAS